MCVRLGENLNDSGGEFTRLPPPSLPDLSYILAPYSLLLLADFARTIGRTTESSFDFSSIALNTTDARDSFANSKGNPRNEESLSQTRPALGLPLLVSLYCSGQLDVVLHAVIVQLGPWARSRPQLMNYTYSNPPHPGRCAS